MRADVDLVVPVKSLDRAKTRLEAGTGRRALALAFALDLVGVARRVARSVLVVTADPVVAGELAVAGVETVVGPEGLNPALRFGASVLRGRDPRSVVGALQADLPALREVELRAAVVEAGGERAFCADRQATGTTLLLSAAGRDLAPAFGGPSAAAHRDGGARELLGDWPTLRCDVDTLEDLALAAGYGLGARSAQAWARVRVAG
ncbi:MULTISPECIES: 2-phospho-L-lactate guanylyltransferase [Actinosynnema]|uniref:Phosphoenolpyruvate guanylyltransferase n=1 Tax=Actinosynnema pretiosum TaxID=42197 RepID=A0A290ZD57_9PSEU|nr:2-phospho-L-lactate guanylyltransferase [Actinosynnema pretiosum]ATE56914.1 2-phospho-L-lactate guanylyltransferase [Actinosynnema pretiosum]